MIASILIATFSALLFQPNTECLAQVVPMYMGSCQNDPTAPVLVADLPFDNDLSDLAGNQYRATGLYGYPSSYTIESANPGEPKALYLSNTVIQSIHDQDSNVMIGKSYTKSIWAYATNENGNDYGGFGVGHLISSFDAFSSTAFSEMFISEQGLVLTHGAFAGVYYVQPEGQFGSNEQILPVRTWTCFTVVYNSATTRFLLYINGILSESQPERFASDWFGSNNAIVEIGDYASQYGGSYRPAQNVYLKYAKIWTGALSAQQVRDSYNADYNKFYNIGGAVAAKSSSSSTGPSSSSSLSSSPRSSSSSTGPSSSSVPRSSSSSTGPSSSSVPRSSSSSTGPSSSSVPRSSSSSTGPSSSSVPRSSSSTGASSLVVDQESSTSAELAQTSVPVSSSAAEPSSTGASITVLNETVSQTVAPIDESTAGEDSTATDNNGSTAEETIVVSDNESTGLDLSTTSSVDSSTATTEDELTGIEEAENSGLQEGDIFVS